MKLSLRLALWLILAMLIVRGAYGYARVSREAQAFRADMRRDHHVVGRVLGASVLAAWEDGEERALDLVARTNERDRSVQIRWIWLDGTDARFQAAAPADALQPVLRGEEASWVYDPPDDHDVFYTYIPLAVPGGRPGALEVAESFAPAESYIAATVQKVATSSAVTALLSGLLAMALGAWFVARPAQALVEKARRAGAGDFTGDVDLGRSDELAEVANAMNEMCHQLDEAQRRLAAEIAERVRAGEQLVHADRLMTVGKLASGVAHELGTPLTVISARAKMIASGEVEGAETSDNARIIAVQADRMSGIIRQLLRFARTQAPTRAELDLRDVARQTLDLLAPIANRRSAELALDLPSEPVRASIDPVQMQQVLTNLVVNGMDAMKRPGRVVISVESGVAVPPGDPLARSIQCVGFRVVDQGEGIRPEHLPHVFDPFFTTKDVGDGTGLGLAVSYGIVRDHGGWMQVESEPGKGACFVVRLPEGP